MLRLTSGADVQTVTVEDFGDDDENEAGEVEEISVAIPSALAVMSVCFGLCVLLLSGLPPLSGFVAKFAMLSAMLNPAGIGAAASDVAHSTWWLIGLVIFSGLAALIVRRHGHGNPHHGELMGDKPPRVLKGCRKVRFDEPGWKGKPRYRFVYRNEPDDGASAKSLILAIGRRDRMIAYAKAARRVKEQAALEGQSR